MSFPSSRPLALVVSVALTSAGLLLLGNAPASAETAPASLSLFASAYGSTAAVGPLTSGETAYYSACSTSEGTQYGSNVAATDLGGLLGKVGAAVTTGTRTGSSMVVTSTTGETSLLGGLLQAKAITSRSTSSAAGGSVSSSGSTMVTGLRIAGLPRTVPAGTGAKIDIPGVATVTFNSQVATTSFTSRRLTVEALRVDVVKGNRLGLQTGSIVVGSSTSGASTPTTFPASGQAYGTTVKVSDLVVSAATAYATMPCGGTGGLVSKRGVSGVALPGLAKVGTALSTVQSIEGAGSTAAVLSNSVTGVDLLNGAVTADAVTAKASTTRSATGPSSTNQGTVISNLKVLGRPVAVGTKDNVAIPVAGVGTLTVRKTVKQQSGLDVIGLELRLSTDQLGMKAGTLVEVAVAKSRVAAS